MGWFGSRALLSNLDEREDYSCINEVKCLVQMILRYRGVLRLYRLTVRSVAIYIVISLVRAYCRSCIDKECRALWRDFIHRVLSRATQLSNPKGGMKSIINELNELLRDEATIGILRSKGRYNTMIKCKVGPEGGELCYDRGCFHGMCRAIAEALKKLLLLYKIHNPGTSVTKRKISL